MKESLKSEIVSTSASNKLYLDVFRNIDMQISSNVKEAEVETRPTQGNGVWCCFLLPTVLVLYSILETVPPIYSLTAYVSVGLLTYGLLFVMFISISPQFLKDRNFSGCIACSLITALLLYSRLHQDLITSLSFGIGSIFSHYILLTYSLRNFPKTFTIGEAFVVTQGLVLFTVMSVGKLVIKYEGKEKELDLINTIIYIALVTVCIIIAILWALEDHHRTSSALHKILSVVVGTMLLLLHLLLGPFVLVQFFAYLFMNDIRVKLLITWLCFVFVAVALVIHRVRSQLKADSGTRKWFHLLAAAVFLVGLPLDPELTRLAAGGALAVLILVEALRKSRIEPYSSALQSAFYFYSDEKDVGAFAMTPIYLFVGLASPLLLGTGEPLERLAGVLTVGVGDSAASVLGSRLGQYHWPGSKKTVEGTAANVVSQVALVYLLQKIGLLECRRGLARAAIAGALTALVEARTSQVDNLVLPPLGLVALRLSNCL